ncbi:ABC transporter permease [Methylobacterium sp. WSM2598]|uniref:ABC transporter permease n=1 Tax=Methylobacterium sp. WSM2598 TaxID=398261 RepID=UPI0003702A3C|nr:ABC transporter permease [Methylobacterium sp. WSM2598]
MIRFVLADLRRLWAASLVIVLLVALSTALGVAVTLQERALRLGSARAADRFDLVVGAPGSEVQLVLSAVFLQPAPLPLVPGDVLARLSGDPRVAWAAPVGFGDSYRGHPIVGTTTRLVEGVAGGIRDGRPFRAEGEAVAGSAVDLPLGTALHPMHGSGGEPGPTHAGATYRLVGRLSPTGTAWDRAILVPIQAVWHVHGLGQDHGQDHGQEHGLGQERGRAGPDGEAAHGRIDAQAPLDETFDHDLPGLPAILVKPTSFAAAYKLRQEYRGGGTLAVFPAEVLTRLYATLGDARQVLMAISAGAEALVAAALLLITVIHVAQRRRQIGALRAFGAPRRAVFLIVWGEAMLLVSAGIAGGVALGYGAARLLARLAQGQGGFTLPVELAAEDAAFAGALLAVASVLALLPAWLAYRQSPAASLRA